MTLASGPNTFWDDVFNRYPERTALVSADGQSISFSQLDRAISNLSDLLTDYGAGEGSRISCSIPNFAVTVASWFATWRIGGHVMTAQDPEQFVQFGLAPDFVLTPSNKTASVGATVPVHPKLLIDEYGAQRRAPAGKTYFHTANTPRDVRAMAVGPNQLTQDARNYCHLLGPATGAVYMTTGLSSLRAMRDVFRALNSGVHVIGGDVAPETAWPTIRNNKVRELMLSPLSLHLLLKHAQKDDQSHKIDRVFVGAGTATVTLLKRAHAFFGDVIELGAGTNETSVYSWKKFDPLTYRSGEIGKTCCGVRAEVRDEMGRPLPPDQPGRLALRVPPLQRFEGYINASPAYDTDGWVYPGFLATMDDCGELTKLERTDDRINLGGTRFFSGKIEAQIERLASVERAAAIRVYAEDGAEALGIVVEPGQDFDADQLKELLARSITGIGEVFVRSMSSLPTNGSGTLDRKSVERLWSELR